jgi:hypothetical protein
MAFARDKDGEIVPILDPKAETFCVLGGLRKLNPFTRETDEHNQLHVASKQLLHMVKMDIVETSDEGQAQALAMLDEAIAYGENNPHPFNVNVE